ncbi:MAG TPA: hypothetical protein VD884_02890 [Ohtaekwangia sp.]|nr:hypothetical protein [Ohtaekwangia sp.]
MSLIQACSNIVNQLMQVVHQLDPATYASPSPALSYSSIGQHIRHTVEFFVCFEEGYHTGIVNYDKRAHDKTIESDKTKALNSLEGIGFFIGRLNLEKTLHLEVNYNHERDETETLATTTKRELVYNIEHAVHHMALIKIGIRELAPEIVLPADFGIAASTIRYKENSTVSSR